VPPRSTRVGHRLASGLSKVRIWNHQYYHLLRLEFFVKIRDLIREH